MISITNLLRWTIFFYWGSNKTELIVCEYAHVLPDFWAAYWSLEKYYKQLTILKCIISTDKQESFALVHISTEPATLPCSMSGWGLEQVPH